MNINYYNQLAKIFIFIPLLSLILGGVAWLKYGIDLPWFDDWRGYMDGNIHSLDPNYLFRAVNDTLAPVGFALDALAQRYLNGNSIAYQLISMFSVLGGLALLQWKLLVKSLENKLQASICFFFTIFMMQPDSYWGWENLAYHQALPLVFILIAIFLVIFSNLPIKIAGPLIFISGILSGFSYISGAISVFICSIFLFSLSLLFFQGNFGDKLRKKSLWLFSAGVLSSIAQIYFSVIKNPGTHTGIPLAFPDDPNFWFFYLGKIGRSLLLPQQSVRASFAITLIVSLIALAIAVIFLLKYTKNYKASNQEKLFAIIYISLGAVIFVYLIIVSAGRANYRPTDVNNYLDVYIYGFHRFHYFWATLFWPWLIAGIIILIRRKKIFSMRIFKISAISIIFVLFVFYINSGIISHFKHNELVANIRGATASCLLNSLQRGPEIHCQGLSPPRNNQDIPDSFPGYLYAHETRASFARGFPIIYPDNFLRNEKIIFQSKISGDLNKFVDLKNTDNYYESISIDPQIEFSISKNFFPGNCIELDIFVDMWVEKNTRAQFFYTSSSDITFNEKNSKSINIESKNKLLQTIVFRIKNKDGFSGNFRFDPVDAPQKFYFNKIQGRCIMVSN